MWAAACHQNPAEHCNRRLHRLAHWLWAWDNSLPDNRQGIDQRSDNLLSAGRQAMLPSRLDEISS